MEASRHSYSSIYNNFPAQLKAAVDDFQRYIHAEHGRGAKHWPYARAQMQGIAEALTHVANAHETPCADLTAIAELLRVSIVPRRGIRESCNLGQLVPQIGGFTVEVNASRWPELSARERFTLAHEFGHAFFFSLHTERPERLIPAALPIAQQAGKREEGLCDAFAATLLVPHSWANLIAHRNPKVAEIVSFATQLGVAPEVLVKRVLHDLGQWPNRVFYSVYFGSGVPQIRVARGNARKQATSAPTAHIIAAKLAIHDAPRAVDSLRKLPEFRDADIFVQSLKALQAMI